MKFQNNIDKYNKTKPIFMVRAIIVDELDSSELWRMINTLLLLIKKSRIWVSLNIKKNFVKKYFTFFYVNLDLIELTYEYWISNEIIINNNGGDREHSKECRGNTY